MAKKMSGTGGQALLETALALPIFVLLLLGIISFTLRTQNQARAAMAARHAAFLGAYVAYLDGHDLDEATSYAETAYPGFTIAGEEKQVEMPEGAGEFSDDTEEMSDLYFGPGGRHNVRYEVTYTQAALPWAAPLSPGAGGTGGGIFGESVNPPVVAYWCDVGSWNDLTGHLLDYIGFGESYRYIINTIDQLVKQLGGLISEACPPFVKKAFKDVEKFMGKLKTFMKAIKKIPVVKHLVKRLAEVVDKVDGLLRVIDCDRGKKKPQQVDCLAD